MEDAMPKFSSIYDLDNQHFPLSLKLAQNELLICSVILNSENWSLLTSQRLISVVDKERKQINMNEAELKSYGMFKDTYKKVYTLGQLKDKKGTFFNYHIETGKASMIMVQGVKMRLLLNPKA